ncbi:hypothetical protein M413DRAFT_267964 [Hebeloma cylindrosporum]|uniref:Uncharacterized protein n=1 Tax=Hebeloma cylindrosporum TaxID=76867 RepID=A0A0C2YB16_HEBCY|nr:hypothetical protein M413DRAFT_267964 [Hebeloma cylindrosporum h7]
MHSIYHYAMSHIPNESLRLFRTTYLVPSGSYPRHGTNRRVATTLKLCMYQLAKPTPHPSFTPPHMDITISTANHPPYLAIRCMVTIAF